MKVIKTICKFACYDKLEGHSTRTTYRIVQGENNFRQVCFWIEQKSMHGKDWFRTYNHHVYWFTLSDVWNSLEFKCLFGIINLRN